MDILIAGDFCDKLRVGQNILENKYDEIFGEVRDTITSVDYSIVNFEFPIVLSAGVPIPKCGPSLKGHYQSIRAIKIAGFKCCTLANNHILDQGGQCALDTKRLLEEKGIDTVGLGTNRKTAGDILYKDINNERLAIINCCEHEFSIATKSSVGASALNPIQQYYSIKEAKANADYVLVIVHGGHEHFQLPSPRMKETYRFFIDVGADAVVNHHQHCYSGYEIYKGKPIFYGLGNFLFDNLDLINTSWNYGFMVTIMFSKEKISFDLHPYSQCNPITSIQLLEGEEKSSFYQEIDKLNNIILDDEKLEDMVDAYYKQCEKYELSILEPYRGKIFGKLYHLGLMPSFVKKKENVLLNHLECESHRDKLIYALKMSRKGIIRK